MWQSVEILNVFNTYFLEKENFFQKTGVPFFSWKHFKIENASSPYETAIS